MNRWKAFSLHWLLSLALITSIAIAALLVWYPYGLYRISGLSRLMAVMLVIDVTAGPLMTLLIYKPGKWGLRFDLTVIALVQAAFLGYGLHTLWLARPVFLVGSDVRFDLVFAGEIDATELAKAKHPEWRYLGWRGPALVGVLPPTDKNERRALLDVYMKTGRDLEQLPSQYRPFQDVVPAMLRNAQPVAGKADLVGVPIFSRNGEGTMLVDAQTGLPRKLIIP
ncbi:MAG: hypothetical protein J7507_08060 [Pseudoxanthomonas sp.]|nr:hypothetical protein [Pseudoxanthomonas sp.]